jgi:hypothetical protein
MKMKSIKRLIKRFLFVDEGPKPLFLKDIIKPLKLSKKNGFDVCEFGNLNPEKVFYVIKRTSHAGIFSYLSFILNHLLVAKENNFIPVVDMCNYVSPYNEKDKISNTENSWEYYFNQTSSSNIDEVYKSKNVILSRDDYHVGMSYQIHLEDNFKQFKYKEISIKEKYYKFLDNYFKKEALNNLKIIGVHFRGTSYKTSRGHIFPATIQQITKHLDNLLDKEHFDKIFLCTEEERYLEYFKKKYSDKLLYLETHRSNKNDAFKIYSRKNHRYLLGDEAIKETLILSKCSSLLYVRSNIINAANYFSDEKQNLYEIFNGFNSRNQFIARWLWFIIKDLPRKFGGLKDELNKLIN